MADEQQTQATQADVKENDKAAASAETKNTDTESQELMIPKHRYDEVSRKLKALEDAADKAAAAQKAAEEKRLEEQAEWQKLAEARGKELQGLTGKAADYDTLAELVGKQLKTEIDAWPEKVKGLFPTEEMSVLEMLRWAERFRPLALEMAGDKGVAPGNGRRPTPISPANAAKADEQQRTQWRQSARHRYK